MCSFGIFGAELALTIDNRYSMSFTVFDYSINFFGARAVFMLGGAKTVKLTVRVAAVQYTVHVHPCTAPPDVGLQYPRLKLAVILRGVVLICCRG